MTRSFDLAKQPRATRSELHRLENLYGQRAAQLHMKACELYVTPMNEDAYHAWADADHRAEQACSGRKICPGCGCRSVHVRSFPTLQYGGGFDTTEECDLNCGYREVFV